MNNTEKVLATQWGLWMLLIFAANLTGAETGTSQLPGPSQLVAPSVVFIFLDLMQAVGGSKTARFARLFGTLSILGYLLMYQGVNNRGQRGSPGTGNPDPIGIEILRRVGSGVTGPAQSRAPSHLGTGG